MQPSSPDTLSLKGILQVDTAISALEAADVNANALHVLTTARSIREDFTKASPDAPERLNLSFGGEFGAAMRADILLGLELLSAHAASPQQMVAAQALLEVLRS